MNIEQECNYLWWIKENISLAHVEKNKFFTLFCRHFKQCL